MWQSSLIRHSFLTTVVNWSKCKVSKQKETKCKTWVPFLPNLFTNVCLRIYFLCRKSLRNSCCWREWQMFPSTCMEWLLWSPEQPGLLNRDYRVPAMRCVTVISHCIWQWLACQQYNLLYAFFSFLLQALLVDTICKEKYHANNVLFNEVKSGK